MYRRGEPKPDWKRLGENKRISEADKQVIAAVYKAESEKGRTSDEILDELSEQYGRSTRQIQRYVSQFKPDTPRSTTPHRDSLASSGRTNHEGNPRTASDLWRNKHRDELRSLLLRFRDDLFLRPQDVPFPWEFAIDSKLHLAFPDEGFWWSRDPYIETLHDHLESTPAWAILEERWYSWDRYYHLCLDLRTELGEGLFDAYALIRILPGGAEVPDQAKLGWHADAIKVVLSQIFFEAQNASLHVGGIEEAGNRFLQSRRGKTPVLLQPLRVRWSPDEKHAHWSVAPAGWDDLEADQALGSVRKWLETEGRLVARRLSWSGPDGIASLYLTLTEQPRVGSESYSRRQWVMRDDLLLAALEQSSCDFCR